MSKIFGIDISKYQKGINLSKAKSEGVEFAILRAGYTGYGNGVSKAKDEEFETHYRNAKNNGLGVGAYWFSRATTYENGKAEAKYMYENCLKGKQFEYPIYIDVEDTYYQSKAGKTAVTNGIKGFCEYLENKGYYVGVYANSSWFKNYIDASIPSKYDCWVANWGTNNPSTPSHGLWQFGGETNKIRTNKIAGYVCDQNYSYKDYPSIMKEYGLNGYLKDKTTNTTNNTTTPPKVENKPTTTQNTTNYITYRVKKGDTLSKIANKYGTTYQKLASYNGISNPNRINVGQVIKIPTSSTSKTTTYTVKSGDTLSAIAKKNGTTVNTIVRDNNIKDPNKIYVGQKLIIK